MNIKVADEFVEFLDTLGQDTSVSTVIAILKWASENPSESAKLIGAVKGLNITSRKEFSHMLLHLSYRPNEALASAIRGQRERYNQHHLLGKILAQLRKNKAYHYRMPRGTHCTITKMPDEKYLFIFTTNGKEVKITYARHFALGAAVTLLTQNIAPTLHMEELRFDGKIFRPYAENTKKILEAISSNIDPNVYAVLDDKE